MTNHTPKRFSKTTLPGATRTVTIGDFWINHLGKINCMPEGQRLDTDPTLIGVSSPSKAQGIIRSLLSENIDLGTIIVSQIGDGDEAKFESVDGGHRKRAISDFLINKFPLFECGRYYRDLTDEERLALLSTELTVIVYTDLAPEDVAHIFQTVNKSTDVNHMEMLNSYNVIPVAKVIRETARSVKGVGNKCHPLFGNYQKNGMTKYDYLNFDNARLKIDKKVARIFYRYYNGGGLGPCAEENLEEMYNAYPDLQTMLKLKKKVNKCLSFIRDMAEVVNKTLRRGLTEKEFRVFERLYMFMETEFGDFKINDKTEFGKAVISAYMPFFKMPYDSQIPALLKKSPFDSTKTIGKQFNDALNVYDTLEHVEFPIVELIKRPELKIEQLITIKDKNRLFSRTDRETKLAEQGFVCAIDGMPLSFEEAEAAHIIAHSLGGRTVYKNLAMVRAKYNKMMGSMSVDDFKKVYMPVAA